MNDSFPFFKASISEVYIFGLFDTVNGGIVDSSWSSWFRSSRKKDTVTIAKLFRIVRRALRRKNLDADEIQNFKRLKLEVYFGGDKRRPETRLHSQAKCSQTLSIYLNIGRNGVSYNIHILKT